MYFDILGFEGIDRFSTRVRSSQSNIDAVVANKIEVAIATRLDFIREKNWAEADRIRDELLAQGIQLKDGKDPVTGERVTTWEVRR
jgi:cysteinyl-tRNA synthetase